jgi:hypothetical protein
LITKEVAFCRDTKNLLDFKLYGRLCMIVVYGETEKFDEKIGES